jgi:thiol-disulfide isomerase/thioredoxin
LKLLKANSIKGAGDFVKTETGRIKYAYATPLLMYPVGHMIMAQDPSYKPDAAYYDVIRSYFVEEEGLIDVDEYRNFIIEAAHVLDEANREVTQIKQKTVAQMNYITDNFSSSTVNASLLHYLAASYVQMYGIDDIQEMLSLFNTYVKDPALVADFQKKYDKWDRSKPGKPSPDFKATDVDGKVWTLADFKGKYVYIDLWATWCNPCKKELPYLKELEKKFEGAEIVFLSLSTDGDKAKWEKMVKEGKMSGVQLHIGPRSDFQLAYNIDGIPRFILLDKEGVIINNNMSRPSSDDTIRTLESLDGIRQ